MLPCWLLAAVALVAQPEMRGFIAGCAFSRTEENAMFEADKASMLQFLAMVSPESTLVSVQ